MSRQSECLKLWTSLNLVIALRGGGKPRERERLCLPFNDLLVQGTDRQTYTQAEPGAEVCVDGDWEAFTRCCCICVCGADFAVLSFLESHNCLIIVITPFYR